MLSKQQTFAARKALRLRLEYGCALDSPCDIYELVSRRGIGLKFTNTGSLAGLFLSDGRSGQIAVSTLRPSGYQHFTAAHELGHFEFDHGARVDGETGEMQVNSQEEIVADAFARHLLMPKRAVTRGLQALGTTPASCTPEEVYIVASWLGVGYTALIQQMKWTLGMISSAKLHGLGLRQPQQIKRKLVPSVQWSGRKELWPLLPWWSGTRIHLQVGDVITGLLPFSSPMLDFCDEHASARAPGQLEARLDEGGVVHLSIARKDFVGLYKYRYLEELPDA